MRKRRIPVSFNAAAAHRVHAFTVALRVLIVDDSQRFLDAARTYLEREGLEVVGIAMGAADACRQAEKLLPDVVLVDITLDGESGFEVARRLVEHDDGGAPAVILISTHAEDDVADLVAESPAIGFLPKAELSADAIHRLLNSGSR
jgi:CheY-like chemotaxis protein